MANSYPVGDGFRLVGTFTVNDVNTDPTTVVFSLLDPDLIQTDYTYGVDAEVVKSAVGVYYMDVTVTKSHTWYYKIVGTGACIAATPDTPFKGEVTKFT